MRDYQRQGSLIGTESLLGLQGSAEEIFREEVPTHPDLARRFVDGQEYVASFGFKPGQDSLYETWLLFRGSIHYDVMEYVVRDRMGIYRGSHGVHIQNVTRTSFGTYNLIHQFGASLTADLAQDAGTQEVTFAFNKGPIQYNAFRQEVKVLMEQVAEQMYLAHASFWQRKLGLCAGKEFVLRLPLPVGKLALQEVISMFAGTGRVGKETIVKRGKLLMGTRVL